MGNEVKTVWVLLISLFIMIGLEAQDKPGLKYHSYESMLEEIKKHQSDYPRICKLYDFGLSSDNKTRMWALKISDNVTQNEDEPQVLLTGGIHGNERPAPEMALYFLNDLLTNQKKHESLINNTQIWVIPMMNSAGHVLNSRYNANRIDLNRSFPKDFNKPDLANTQPEIANLIKNFFQKYPHVVAGIDIHTFGEVYMSSWARSTRNPADWLAIKDLGQKMAKSSGYRFVPLHKFIRRTVLGGGADYRYGAHGSFYYGLELGRMHHPPESSLRALCERNIKSIYMMMNRVHYSTLTGLIKKDGKPIQATVVVDGVDSKENIRLPFKSDSTFGRYYRILMPGKYTVSFFLDNQEKTIVHKDIEIVEDKQTILDINF